MAYEDWSAEYQDLFDDMTDYLADQDFLSPEELQQAENLFESAFVPDFISEDYTWFDVRGEDFFDFLGIVAEMFDWDAWREAYEG